MSNVLVEESCLQNIADAIRAKNSKTDKYTPSQMADAISNIKTTVTETQGDLQIVSPDAWSLQITQTDHQTISANFISKLISKSDRKYSSALDTDITVEPYTGYVPGTIKRSADTTSKVYNITASPAEEIAGMVENGWTKVYVNNRNFYSDEDCKNNISSRSLSGDILVVSEKNTDSFDFFSPSKLIKLKDTFIKIVGNSFLNNCSSITTVDLPNLINVWNDCFFGCSSLTTVDFPNLTSIENNSFNNCRSLTTVNLPSLTSARDSFLSNCRSLTTVNLPNLTNAGGDFLYNCNSLTTVDLPSLTSVGRSFLNKCTNLKSVYLRSLTMCKVDEEIDVYSFPSSASIYVPASLINDYKTDSNWSGIAGQFKTLESIA